MKSWPRLSSTAVLCILLLVGTVGSSASPFGQAIPEWAQQHTQQWYAAFNAGDVIAITRLYAANAVMLLQGQTFEGRPAIEAFHKGNFEKARFACTWTIDGMSTVDRVAVLWGSDSCLDTPRTGGTPVNWKGRWLTVYQLQPDGSWMIVRDSGEEA